VSQRIGYGRVSKRDQNPDSQRDALKAAGCAKVFIDKASGKLASRPELEAALEYAREGDVFVITRLSRAARSLKNLIELGELLHERGIELVVLKQGIDTTTPTGRLAFHMLGAIDEFTRELIVEGTQEGLAAARARGRVGGRRPKLSDRQVTLARQMYDSREHTVEQIAETFGVSRATIYRHLEADQTGPAGDVDQAAPASSVPPGDVDQAAVVHMREDLIGMGRTVTVERLANDTPTASRQGDPTGGALAKRGELAIVERVDGVKFVIAAAGSDLRGGPDTIEDAARRYAEHVPARYVPTAEKPAEKPGPDVVTAPPAKRSLRLVGKPGEANRDSEGMADGSE
jgi:DNA invertase Pin-like site-specific DNA recombinase